MTRFGRMSIAFVGLAAAGAAACGAASVALADTPPTPDDDVGVAVVADEAPSSDVADGLSTDAAEVHALIFSGAAMTEAGFPPDLGVSTSTDPSTGRLVVTAPPQFVDALDAALAPHGGSYVIYPAYGEVRFQTRS